MYTEGFQSNASDTSNTTSFYKKVYDYTPPNDTCTVPKQSYNQNYNTTNTSLDTLRSTQGCLTDTVKHAQEIEQQLYDTTSSNSRVSLIQKYEKVKTVFDSYVESVGVLQTARGPFDTYMADLSEKQTELDTEYIKIQQGIRAGRRRFLDSDPQSGVTSILGIQTADDKVLLAFWLCFAAGIIAMEFFLLRQFGGILQLVSTQQKVTIFLVVLALCMGIAQLFIRMYA